MMNYNECLLKAAIHHGAAMALVLGTREVIKDCTSNELAVISDCLAHGLNERGTYKVASHLSRHVHDIDINKVYNKVDQLIKIAKIVTDKTIEDELIKLAADPKDTNKLIDVLKGLGGNIKDLLGKGWEGLKKLLGGIWGVTKDTAKGWWGVGKEVGRNIGAGAQLIGHRVARDVPEVWGSLSRAGKIGVGATAAAALAALGYYLYRMFAGGGAPAAAEAVPEAAAGGPGFFANLLGSITLPDIVGAGGLGLVLYDLLRKRKKEPGEASNVLADYWPTILGLSAAGLGFAPRIIGAFKS
jgi:hypothetical protein